MSERLDRATVYADSVRGFELAGRRKQLSVDEAIRLIKNAYFDGWGDGAVEMLDEQLKKIQANHND